MVYLKIAAIALVATAAWLVLFAYAAFDGWFNEPLAARGDARAFMDAATRLIDENRRGDVALVLIEDGEVFGTHYAPDRGSAFPWFEPIALHRVTLHCFAGVNERKARLHRPAFEQVPVER